MKRFLSTLLAVLLCAAMMIAGMLSGYAQEPTSGSSSEPASSSSSEPTDENDSPKPPRRMPNNKGDSPD